MNIRYQLKKLLKNRIAIVIVAFFIYVVLKLLRMTMRCTTVGAENVENISGSVILCFWHGRLLMMPCFSPNGKVVNVLSSHHSDGQLIGQVQKLFGLNVIDGSSSRGGFMALRNFYRVKKRGEWIALTPDGPRGPARKIGGLIVEIAKKLDIPIIPVTFACNNYKTVNSWDSLMIPKPFSKGVFVVGEPIKYDNIAELEVALNKLTDEADSAFKTL